MLTSHLRKPLTRYILSVPNHQIRYTRQYFQELNIDHTQLQRIQKTRQQQQLKNKILNIQNNDRNPNNYIKKLKVNSEAHDVFKKFDENNIKKQCCILVPEPPKSRVFISAKRKYIITSIKKAKNALHPLKKKYLFDAISIAENSKKKVAKLIFKTLNNLVRHAIDRDFDPLRLYIHGIIIGKTMRYKGIRYHAKGKTGREKKDICQVKVILYEKDQIDFWKDIGTGHAPAGFADFVRKRLVMIKADHQKIMQYTGITTAKGRQQKRQILRRKVSWKMFENKKAGVYVPKKIIEKELSEQEGQKAKQLLANLRAPNQLPSVKSRQIVFKNNQNQ